MESTTYNANTNMDGSGERIEGDMLLLILTQGYNYRESTNIVNKYSHGCPASCAVQLSASHKGNSNPRYDDINRKKREDTRALLEFLDVLSF